MDGCCCCQLLVLLLLQAVVYFHVDLLCQLWRGHNTSLAVFELAVLVLAALRIHAIKVAPPRQADWLQHTQRLLWVLDMYSNRQLQDMD